MTNTDTKAGPHSQTDPDGCATIVSGCSKASTWATPDESNKNTLATETSATGSNSPGTPKSLGEIAVPPDNNHDSIPPVAALPSPDRRRRDGIQLPNIYTSISALVPSLPTQKSVADSFTQTDIQLGTEGDTTILLTQPDQPSLYPQNIRKQDLSDDRDLDLVVKEPFLDINAHRPNTIQPVNILEQEKHLKVEEFFRQVQEAREHSRPRHAKYPAVHVLLIHWIDHGVKDLEKEVDAVEEVFQTHYAFTVDRWELPTSDADLSLDDGLVKFRKMYPNESDLYIIYYNGHGFVENDECHWASSDATTEGASFAWNPVQKKLERDKHEILFILDCCYAGAAAYMGGPRTAKELLAAVDHRTETPAGRDSFSNRLVEAFKYCQYKPVTVWWLDQYLRKTRKINRHDPWSLELDTRHICLQPGRQPIVISPIQKNHANQLVNQEELLFETLPDHDDVTEGTSITPPNGALVSELPSNVNDTPLTTVSGPLDLPPLPGKRRYFANFSVLIEEDVILDEDNPHVPDWETWLGEQAPPGFAALEGISIDASYQSGSALLIVSVPLSVWDFLPPNLAYKFLGLTHSQNLVRHSLPSALPEVSTTNKTNAKRTIPGDPPAIHPATPPATRPATPSAIVDTPAEWITDLSRLYEKRFKHGKPSTLLGEAADIFRIHRIGKDPAYVLLKEVIEKTTYHAAKTKPTSSADHATISRRIDDLILKLEKLKLQPSDTNNTDPFVQSFSLELNILKTQISELRKEDAEKLLKQDLMDAFQLEREKEDPGDGHKFGRSDSSLRKVFSRRMTPKAGRGGNNG